jgi:hypothetical protein
MTLYSTALDGAIEASSTCIESVVDNLQACCVVCQSARLALFMGTCALRGPIQDTMDIPGRLATPAISCLVPALCG